MMSRKHTLAPPAVGRGRGSLVSLVTGDRGIPPGTTASLHQQSNFHPHQPPLVSQRITVSNTKQHISPNSPFIPFPPNQSSIQQRSQSTDLNPQHPFLNEWERPLGRENQQLTHSLPPQSDSHINAHSESLDQRGHERLMSVNQIGWNDDSSFYNDNGNGSQVNGSQETSNDSHHDATQRFVRDRHDFINENHSRQSVMISNSNNLKSSDLSNASCNVTLNRNDFSTLTNAGYSSTKAITSNFDTRSNATDPATASNANDLASTSDAADLVACSHASDPAVHELNKRKKTKHKKKLRDPLDVALLAAREPGRRGKDGAALRREGKPSISALYSAELLPHQQIHSTFSKLPTDSDLDVQARRFFRESIYIDGKAKLAPFPREITNCPISADLKRNIAELPDSFYLNHLHR